MPSGRRRAAPGPRPGHQPWRGEPWSKFHITGRLPVGAARAGTTRGLRSAPRLTSGRAPRRTERGSRTLPLVAVAATVAASRLVRAAPSLPGSRPRSEGHGKLVRPRRSWLYPEPASKARRRSPGRGAGVPQLAGRLRVAGRGRSDSGALRARWGSHSDEIPVPGQRHQPASAFLLPSQIETEGGGREVEKKKATREGGREGEAREVLRPDPLVATSALPGGPAQGAPAAERPHSLSPRWAGGSPALGKTRIDQTRKEFFSTANEQEPPLLLVSLSAGPRSQTPSEKKAHTGGCALGLQPEALVLATSLHGRLAQICQGL